MVSNQSNVKDKLRNGNNSEPSQNEKHEITSFSDYINQPMMIKRISEVVGPDESKQVALAIIQAHSLNPKLKKCDPGSIAVAGLTSATYKLPINSNLGYAYIIPYGNKAQFQIGYKGIIQLALRTSQYKTINVTTVKENELIKTDRLRGYYEFEFIDDDDERDKLKTVGYLAYFELHSGFRKSLYMSASSMQKHAKKFSKAYQYDLNKHKSSSFWTTDFESQGLKTVLKRLISKWGILSIEMQKAFAHDQSVGTNIEDLEQYEYVDNGGDPDPKVYVPDEIIVEATNEFVEATDIDGEDLPDFLQKDK